MSDNKLREEIERIAEEKKDWKSAYELSMRFRDKDSEIIELLRDKVFLLEESLKHEKHSHDLTIEELSKAVDKNTKLENELTSISEDARPF